MPLIYLTHPRQWTVYDLWSEASDAQAIVVDVPASLMARWQAVRDEFAAVQRALHDIYHDAWSQQRGAVMPFFHFDPVQLLDLLHDLEWVAEPGAPVQRCPICARHEPEHMGDCRLAAMLTQVTADLAQFKEP
jgi:hypothetical protein